MPAVLRLIPDTWPRQAAPMRSLQGRPIAARQLHRGCRGDRGTEQGLAGDAENGCPDVEADFIERLVMRVFDELVEVGARGGRAGSSVREVDVRADARRR
jgi:hypothetical protein